MVKNLPASAGEARDARPIHGSGRCPGGGNGHPLQFLPEETPWTEEPGSYSPWGCKESDVDLVTKQQQTTRFRLSQEGR